MTSNQTALALLVDVVVVATLAGLVARGRWRLCVAFVGYLAFALAFNLSVVLWPGRFYTSPFWIAAHGIFDALRMAIALEVAWRVFRPAASDGSQRTPYAGIVVVTVACAITALRFVAPHPWGFDLAWLWANGPFWTMLATLILARVARVKIDRFHRALLLSFALYVGIFAVALRPLLDWGLDGGLFQRLEPFGFLALVCWWAYIAVRGTSRSDHPRRPGSGPLPDAADLATGRRPPLSPHERAALAAATT